MALTTAAIAAFQPNWSSMKALSHCQVVATISTGGAAYDVSVPPIDTLTKSTPNARYFAGSGTRGAKTLGASINAAMVIAAGSVISDPSSGMAARPSQRGGDRRRQRQPARQEVDGATDGQENRSRCGDDHHHEHEERLGVVARLGIGQGVGAAFHDRQGDDEDDGPKAEDDFDFA